MRHRRPHRVHEVTAEVQPGAKDSDAQKDKRLGQWIYRNADQLGRGGNRTVYQAP